MQRTNISGAKAKSLLSTSRGGTADCLKFCHVLFEVSGRLKCLFITPLTVECQEDSSDTASESDQDGE
jgi:hypothetical protein